MDLLNIDLPEDTAPAASNETLDRNLRQLALTSPLAAEQIAAAPQQPGVLWTETEETHDDGSPALGLTLDGRTLASKRRPLTEAARFADTVDVAEHAALAVVGFGAGHHCRLLCERMRGQGVVICFEPDLGLLREVLSRIDITGWLNATRFVLITDETDRAALARALDGIEGVIAMGVKIVEHPPSKARLKDQTQPFADRFTEILRATKTQVTTTLVQSERTLRNLLMNLDHYAGCPGVADLAGIASDRPAVVVAAGPSLQQNLAQLAAPGVRDRVVIIAVQTVLKAMLARGIKPHFVTTLDYHEISTRFYEGLTAADVEGITLIADPKVNPAVLGVWPGKIRLIASDLLDGILGPTIPAHGTVKAGATVAHLSHYVARHLGCDPVILVGQDLGFTDGVYYGPGAAIHDTWAAELGPFRTLEQLEWERVARHKNMLRPATDTHGRPIFTDDQMASYLAQFETDFTADEALGLTVIDATEGGVAKKRTVPLPLREALTRYATHPRSPLPEAAQPTQNAAFALERLQLVRTQAQTIAARSTETADLLGTMLKHQRDQSRINSLITKVNTIRDEVLALDPGWRLTEFVNQAGTLERIKADRKIKMGDTNDPHAMQRLQIERDQGNVQRVADAAERLDALLGECEAMLEGTGPRYTRDPATAPTSDSANACQTSPAEIKIECQPEARIEILIPVDLDRSGLGTLRDLAKPVADSQNALRLTVARVLLAERATRVRLLCTDPNRVIDLLGTLAAHPRVAIESAQLNHERSRRLGAARAFAAQSWRGGPGGLTCYDEIFDPALIDRVMQAHQLTAAVLVGPDWALVDPALLDAVIERHLEAPAQRPVTFTQAAPGFAGMLLGRATVRKLAEAAPHAGIVATIGGILGYRPDTPIGDPIANAACVTVPTSVRDAGRRVIADSVEGRELIAETVRGLGRRWIEAGAADIAAELHDLTPGGPGPRHLELECCTGRLSSNTGHEPAERRVLRASEGQAVLHALGNLRADAALTLGGAGDPLLHRDIPELIAAAREAGLASVHLRTELLHEGELDRVLAARPDIISVDLHARNAPTYRQVTGLDAWDTVHERLHRLIEWSRSIGTGGLPGCWIVPRLTRRDAVLNEIPDWYDGILAALGTAVLDPAPATPAERLRPLPLPAAARTRLDTESLLIRSDLTVPELGDALGRSLTLDRAWRRVLRLRRSETTLIEPKPAAHAAA